MKRTSLVLLMLFLVAITFSLAEEVQEPGEVSKLTEKEKVILAAFDSLPDDVTTERFGKFRDKLISEVSFNGESKFDYSLGYECQENAFAALGLSNFHDVFGDRDRKKSRARSKGLSVFTPWSLKRELLFASLPRILLFAKSLDPQKQWKDERLICAYAVWNDRYGLYSSAKKPLGHETTKIALEFMENEAKEMKLFDRYEKLISSRASSLKVQGNTPLEKIACIRTLARENEDFIFRVVLFHWLHKNISATDVLRKAVPKNILPDYYLRIYGIFKEYVKEGVFGSSEDFEGMFERKKQFTERLERTFFTSEKPEDNLMLCFVGSYFIDALFAGKDAPLLRVEIARRFFRGKGLQLYYITWSPSLMKRLSTFIEKYWRVPDDSRLGSQPKYVCKSDYFLKLVEEGKSGASWFVGNAVPKGKKGKKSIKRDFVYPHFSHLITQKFTPLIVDINKDPAGRPYLMFRGLLDSTDSFEWKKGIYRIADFGIERDYKIGIELPFDYSIAGIEDLDREGWIRRAFLGSAQTNAPLLERTKLLDRAIYYHYPSTKYRLYSLANSVPEGVPSYSYPAVYIEIIPDSDVQPDKARAAYIPKNADWVARTGIEVEGSSFWFIKEFQKKDCFSEICKKGTEICSVLEENFVENMRKSFAAMEKLKNRRLGRPDDWEKVFTRREPSDLEKHKQEVSERIREIYSSIPSPIDDSSAEKLFQSLKSVVKLRPIGPTSAHYVYITRSSLNEAFQTFTVLGKVSIGRYLFHKASFDLHSPLAIRGGNAEMRFIEEPVLIRLFLEGEFETKYLEKASFFSNLKSPKRLKDFRYFAAFLLMQKARLNYFDAHHDKWISHYAKEMIVIDALDKKHGVTEYIEKAVNEARVKMNLDNLEATEALKLCRKTLGEYIDVSEIFAAMNWILSDCPRELILKQQIPQVLEAGEFGKYNTLFSKYIREDFSNPVCNSWTKVEARNQGKSGFGYDLSGVVCDIRAISEFVDPVLAGEDAPLLRKSYFYSAFDDYLIKKYFLVVRAFSFGKSKKKMDSFFSRAIVPYWKQLKQDFERERASLTEVARGTLKDVWLPLYRKLDSEHGTTDFDSAFVFPFITEAVADPQISGRNARGHLIGYALSGSNLFFNNSKYDPVFEPLMKCAFPVKVDYDFRFESLKAKTEIVSPWSSPVAGLNAEEFSYFKKAKRMAKYKGVFFAHYSEVSWTAYFANFQYPNKVGFGSNIKITSPGVAIAVFPRDGEVPDKIIPGLVHGSPTKVCTDINERGSTHIPGIARLKVLSHIKWLAEREEMELIREALDEFVNEAARKALAQKQMMKEHIAKINLLWGEKSIRWSNYAPNWMGK